jgi:hypothetical protein
LSIRRTSRATCRSTPRSRLLDASSWPTVGSCRKVCANCLLRFTQ